MKHTFLLNGRDNTFIAFRVMYALFVIVISGIAHADELVYPGQFSTFAIKAGYDINTDTGLDNCVTGSDRDEKNAGLTHAIVNSRIVENKSDLISKITGNTKLGFKVFSVENDSLRNVTINDYSAYVLLSFEVEKGRRLLQDIRFKDDAKSWLMQGADAFRKYCGTGFFVGEYGGGYFYGLIQVNTKSQIEKSEMENKLNALFNGVTFDNTSKSELTKTLESKDVKMWVLQSGGTSVPIAARSIDDFLEKITKTVAGIIETPNSRAAYQYRAYDRVPGYVDSPLPAYIETRLKNRADVINVYYKLDKLYRNISFILENPAQFDAFDRETFVKRSKEIATDLKSLGTYLVECSTDLNKCEHRTPIDFGDIKLPNRLEHQKCEMRRSQTCGVESYKLARSVSCGVDNYVSRRDPMCGIAGYAKAKSIACGVESYNQGSCLVVYRNTYKDAQPENIIYKTFPCIGNVEVKEENILEKRAFRKGYCNNDLIYQEEHKGGSSSTRRFEATQCRHSEFGVEHYKECESASHGVIYNFCRKQEFGVESYKECRHKDNGVEQFIECNVYTNDAGVDARCE